MLEHFYTQDPSGIFELIEVVGNGTYGQVHKVIVCVCVIWGVVGVWAIVNTC